MCVVTEQLCDVQKGKNGRALDDRWCNFKGFCQSRTQQAKSGGSHGSLGEIFNDECDFGCLDDETLIPLIPVWSSWLEREL